MKINEIINQVRNGKLVKSLKLKDASRYASNSTGEMTFAVTLFQKSFVTRREGDEVVLNGKMQVNISELTRILTSLIGKGDVFIWVGDKAIVDEIEA